MWPARYKSEHHQHVLSAIFKAITGFNVQVTKEAIGQISIYYILLW